MEQHMASTCAAPSSCLWSGWWGTWRDSLPLMSTYQWWNWCMSGFTAVIISRRSFRISSAFTLTSLEYLTGCFNFILWFAILIKLWKDSNPTILKATQTQEYSQRFSSASSGWLAGGSPARFLVGLPLALVSARYCWYRSLWLAFKWLISAEVVPHLEAYSLSQVLHLDLSLFPNSTRHCSDTAWSQLKIISKVCK